MTSRPLRSFEFRSARNVNPDQERLLKALSEPVLKWKRKVDFPAEIRKFKVAKWCKSDERAEFDASSYPLPPPKEVIEVASPPKIQNEHNDTALSTPGGDITAAALGSLLGPKSDNVENISQSPFSDAVLVDDDPSASDVSLSLIEGSRLDSIVTSDINEPEIDGKPSLLDDSVSIKIKSPQETLLSVSPKISLQPKSSTSAPGELMQIKLSEIPSSKEEDNAASDILVSSASPAHETLTTERNLSEQKNSTTHDGVLDKTVVSEPFSEACSKVDVDLAKEPLQEKDSSTTDLIKDSSHGSIQEVFPEEKCDIPKTFSTPKPSSQIEKSIDTENPTKEEILSQEGIQEDASECARSVISEIPIRQPSNEGNTLDQKADNSEPSELLAQNNTDNFVDKPIALESEVKENNESITKEPAAADTLDQLEFPKSTNEPVISKPSDHANNSPVSEKIGSEETPIQAMNLDSNSALVAVEVPSNKVSLNPSPEFVESASQDIDLNVKAQLSTDIPVSDIIPSDKHPMLVEVGDKQNNTYPQSGDSTISPKDVNLPQKDLTKEPNDPPQSLSPKVEGTLTPSAGSVPDPPSEKTLKLPQSAENIEKTTLTAGTPNQDIQSFDKAANIKNFGPQSKSIKSIDTEESSSKRKGTDLVSSPPKKEKVSSPLTLSLDSETKESFIPSTDNSQSPLQPKHNKTPISSTISLNLEYQSTPEAATPGSPKQVSSTPPQTSAISKQQVSADPVHSIPEEHDANRD